MIIGEEWEDNFLGIFGKKDRAQGPVEERRLRKDNTIRDLKDLGGFEGIGRGLRQVGGLFQANPNNRANDFAFRVGQTPPFPNNQQQVPVWVYVAGISVLVLGAGAWYYFQQQGSNS